MRKTFIRCLAVLFLTVSAPMLYAAPASRIQANYDVLGYGMKLISISETYTRTQDHYQIESVSKAVGLLARFKPETIRVVSKGLVTAQGLRPETFTNRRELDTERNTSAIFNWDKATILHHDYLGERTAVLPAGTQDRLSAMYQFQFLPLQNMSEVNFTITNGRDLDKYSYHITPEQSVTVPLGTFKARYLSIPKQEDGSTFEIWLASDLGNIPCKIVITDADGKKATQVLTELTVVP